jgi:hypothetical protein
MLHHQAQSTAGQTLPDGLGRETVENTFHGSRQIALAAGLFARFAALAAPADPQPGDGGDSGSAAGGFCVIFAILVCL